MSIFSNSIRYFERVAHEGSVRKAAALLYIAPSAVSRQIAMLEEELGVALFERLPKGIKLTAAGEILLFHVGTWQQERIRLFDTVRSLVGGQAGRVRLSVPESLANRIVPAAIFGLQQKLPRVRVEVNVALADAAVEEVLGGNAEIGAAFNLPDEAQLRIEARLNMRLGAVVSRSHPLAAASETSLTDCSRFPILVPASDLLDRSSLRTFFRSAHETHMIAAVANRIGTLKALASTGVGIGFLTRLDVGTELASGDLVFVPLRDKGARSPELSVFSAKRARLSSAAALLLEHLRTELDTQAGEAS